MKLILNYSLTIPLASPLSPNPKRWYDNDNGEKKKKKKGRRTEEKKKKNNEEQKGEKEGAFLS